MEPSRALPRVTSRKSREIPVECGHKNLDVKGGVANRPALSCPLILRDTHRKRVEERVTNRAFRDPRAEGLHRLGFSS
ncbi:hypothetical protein MUK42_34161 [Musa troglodytarum]|uniref:Uncharacterized protein n=1 Tax=Musa troglodytarum TaxID=320322 RepID=A0A9E7GFE1_9LILI|nr:hypothetical protein MUK42_34161 [Musa troglodytarum]